MIPKSVSGRAAAMVFSSIFLLAGCRSAKTYVSKGDAALASGQIEDATLNFRKAIQKDPSYGEAYHRAALAELKLNKTMQALEDLQKAVSLMPDNQAAKNDLTNLMLGAYVGDAKRPKFLYDLLVNTSAAWLKRDPNSAQGLRIEGYLAMLERRPEEAVAMFERAYRSHPRDEKVVDGLMDALFRANQNAEAEKVGLDFLKTDSGASDVYDALFRMYMADHRQADAENILTRKVNANPKEKAYLLQLAGFYAGTQNKPAVDRTMQHFMSNANREVKAYLDAGDFYASIGDLDSALKQYRAGTGADKKDELLYENRIARILLLQNKRQEGLNTLNQTLSRHPDDREAGALRAALLVGDRRGGKSGEGVEELRALVQKNPNDLFLKFLLARGLAESQNFAEASSRLREVVRERPQFLDAHILLADIAFRQHDVQGTLEHAESALRINPQNAKARMLRGSALLQQGSLDQAEAVLNGLARQAPDSVDVQLKLAYVELKRRNYSGAESAFNKILQAHSTEWRAVAGLVDTDLAQNHPDKALARLEAELTRSHGSPVVRHLMAATALRSGQYNLAIDNLRALANLTPSSIDPRIELANVFELKGDVRNAIVTLQQAAMIQPSDPRPSVLLPSLLEADNRSQEAKQVARRALASRPKDAVAMNNLAYLLAETGDNLDEAVRLARQAVGQAPDNPVFLDTLGFIYLKRDQNDDALDVFGRLIRRYPDDAACAYHTGMAWFQKGDRARARTLLTHALDLRPSKDIQAGAHDLLTRIN